MDKVFFRVIKQLYDEELSYEVKEHIEIPFEKFNNESKSLFMKTADSILLCDEFYRDPVGGFLYAFKTCFDMDISYEDFKPVWKSLMKYGCRFDFYGYKTVGYKNQRYISKNGCENKSLSTDFRFFAKYNKYNNVLFIDGEILGECYEKGYYCYKVQEKYEYEYYDSYNKITRKRGDSVVKHVFKTDFERNRVII